MKGESQRIRAMAIPFNMSPGGDFPRNPMDTKMKTREQLTFQDKVGSVPRGHLFCLHDNPLISAEMS